MWKGIYARMKIEKAKTMLKLSSYEAVSLPCWDGSESLPSCGRILMRQMQFVLAHSFKSDLWVWSVLTNDLLGWVSALLPVGVRPSLSFSQPSKWIVAVGKCPCHCSTCARDGDIHPLGLVGVKSKVLVWLCWCLACWVHILLTWTLAASVPVYFHGIC